MSTRASRSSAPVVVSLPGSLSGVTAIAANKVQATVTLEQLSDEGIAVETRGPQGPALRAAYETARLLLEALGEEAQLRVMLELENPSISPISSAAAATAAALIELLGVEPGPQELARVLNRAVAIASGRPRAALTAAALLGGLASGSEQPPYYARHPVKPPSWRIYVAKPCKPLPEPPVLVTADKLLQLSQAAATLLAAAATEGWNTRLAKLMAQESPWDYAAPEPVKRARREALEAGAVAAGLDPYTGVLVVLAEEPGPAERAAAILEAAQGCRPELVELQASDKGALLRREAEEV
ncbi:hypothetical protein Pyrde_0175 [Pyrodictium delaneyi]|uniref:Uncharacterized protein n=1 Tax=Pyrodictium delaneyi TaxID=1273541 RepID=A0A0N7JCS7_9CREN|nr:hypothetical protein [Pyrodictium delaneyi]ALL00225.1 hypothetical protein Pyrde_0175 [Pyrodictium delaneyi]